MAGITLPEFMKTVQDPLRKGIIMTLYTEEPLLQYIPFKTINALAYPYSVTESLPGIQFRKLNKEFAATEGVVNREIEALKILGADSDTDIELINAYGRGERTGRDVMKTKAIAIKFVQQFLYGNSGARTSNAFDDVDGFDGIQARLTTAQIVDGGGSSTTACSSVFAIRFGDPYCVGLQSHPVNARNLGELQSGAPCERTRIDWCAGFAIFHGKSVGWLKDVDTTNKVTISLMDQLNDKIEGGAPTIYVMSRRSRRQIKEDAFSKNVVLPLGMNSLGQPVITYDGAPILVSDAIIDTEDGS